MERTGLKSVLLSKIVGMVLVTLGFFYAVVKMPSLTFWGGLAWLICLIAINSVRDHNYKRDYASEPITVAESTEDIVKILVEHLESSEHADGDCDPCPVPDMLSRLRLESSKRDSPQQS